MIEQAEPPEEAVADRATARPCDLNSGRSGVPGKRNSKAIRGGIAKNVNKAQAVERMMARNLSLPGGYNFERDKANDRRTAIAAAKDKWTEGPGAARSQDFLFDEDGLPG